MCNRTVANTEYRLVTSLNQKGSEKENSQKPLSGKRQF